LDLDALAPGPALAAMLASIDRSLLGASDLPVLLAARYRQLAYEHAQLYLDVVAVSCADGLDSRLLERSELPQARVVGQISTALTLSKSAADQLLFIASQLATRMPQVAAALAAGRLDAHKVWIFVDYLASLTDEKVTIICDRLVPPAVDWTSTQLRARLRRALLELDPDWRHRRYRKAVAGRHLSRYLNDDGSATISGVGVPITEAIAACARVETLAAAAHAAGHPCPIRALQADVFLGLICGGWQHLSDEQIVAALLERGTRTEDSRDTRAPENVSTLTRSVRQKGWDIQIGLPTLLGLDERVGVIAGWGALPARIARDIVSSRWRGQWRFVVLDSTGRMAFAGITRHRPCRPPEADDPGGVELRLSAAELRKLFDADLAGPWRAIIGDINTEYQRFRAGPNAWLERFDRLPGGRGIRDYAQGGTNAGSASARYRDAKTKGWWSVTEPEYGRFIWEGPLKHGYYSRRAGPVRPDADHSET
jgi:hypothetical protein